MRIKHEFTSAIRDCAIINRRGEDCETEGREESVKQYTERGANV